MKNVLYFWCLASFVMVFTLSQCSDGGEGNNLIDSIPDDLKSQKTLTEEEQKVEEIVQNISSPVEMAALIKDVGVPFSIQYLCPTQDVDNYSTNFKKSLMLGMFGSDLGYLNIYSKTSSVVTYLTAIKKLADGLNIGQFFDFGTLKRLAVNNENLDSLMYISVNSFNQMDDYLRSNKRGNYSALIITGVWLEGMFLATQVVKEKPNKAIAERIGEQKIILEQLIFILSNYRKDDKFPELIKDIEEIKKAYDGVTIVVEKGESKTELDKEGRLVIVPGDRSIINITDQQLNNIINIVEKVRNKNAQ